MELHMTHTTNGNHKTKKRHMIPATGLELLHRLNTNNTYTFPYVKDTF
jgi:hypothetical protein